MVFESIKPRECMKVFIVSVPKKENYANSKWMSRKFFCWRSNLTDLPQVDLTSF